MDPGALGPLLAKRHEQFVKIKEIGTPDGDISFIFRDCLESIALRLDRALERIGVQATRFRPLGLPSKPLVAALIFLYGFGLSPGPT